MASTPGERSLNRSKEMLCFCPRIAIGSVRTPLANFSGISSNSLIGKWLRAPFRLIPGSAVFPILQGPLRGKKWIVGSANHGCWLGSYEHDKRLQFQKAIKPENVVYDVGANAGFYSLLASVIVGQKGHVYAFEPLPTNVKNLRRHLELNRVSNCAVIEAAVGSMDGEALLDPSADRHTAHLSPNGSIHVRTVSLDTLVSSNEILPPNFIKIDIEGAEYECLNGSQKTIRAYRPVIFLATHGNEIHDACLRLLAEWHYDVASLDERPTGPSDEFIASPGKRRD